MSFCHVDDDEVAVDDPLFWFVLLDIVPHEEPATLFLAEAQVFECVLPIVGETVDFSRPSGKPACGFELHDIIVVEDLATGEEECFVVVGGVHVSHLGVRTEFAAFLDVPVQCFEGSALVP